MHEWFCDWYRIKEWLRLPVEVTCAQEGHPEITAQDQSLMAFECLHGWRLHTFSGQPVPVLIHALTKKKVFIDVQKRPLLFYFVPSALSCHWVPSEVSDCLLSKLPSGIWWNLSLCVTYLVCYPCFIDLTCLIVKEDLFLRLSNSVICLFFFFLILTRLIMVYWLD